MVEILGTTEVGELSSSEDASCCLTRLLERVGWVERGAGVCGISKEPVRSKLQSSSNLPIKGIGRRIKTTVETGIGYISTYILS